MPYLFKVEKALNSVKHSRRLNKEQIKKQFFYHNINKEVLSARADTIKDYQEAMKIIRECENIIKTNKKKKIGFAYKQGKIFKIFM